MKDFFRQHGLRILALAAAVAVALSLLTYFSSTSSVLENIAGVLTSPFRAAATAVSDWAADKRQYYEDVTALKEENAALKKEIADLRAQQRQAQADSEENKLFRKLLKLQEQRRDFTFVSASVLASSESNWTSSLTLSHGTDSDIAVGDCVVSAEGYLVGVVSESRAQLVDGADRHRHGHRARRAHFPHRRDRRGGGRLLPDGSRAN